MTPRRMFGGRHLNSGIRGGLWEKKHSDAMGESVLLTVSVAYKHHDTAIKGLRRESAKLLR